MVFRRLSPRACERTATKQEIRPQGPGSYSLHRRLHRCAHKEVLSLGAVAARQAMFTAGTEGYPRPFKNPAQWTRDFKDFMGRCLTIDPQGRATAAELLQVLFPRLYAPGRLKWTLTYVCSPPRAAPVLGQGRHEEGHEKDFVPHLLAEHHGDDEPRWHLGGRTRQLSARMPPFHSPQSLSSSAPLMVHSVSPPSFQFPIAM